MYNLMVFVKFRSVEMARMHLKKTLSFAYKPETVIVNDKAVDGM